MHVDIPSGRRRWRRVALAAAHACRHPIRDPRPSSPPGRSRPSLGGGCSLQLLLPEGAFGRRAELPHRPRLRPTWTCAPRSPVTGMTRWSSSTSIRPDGRGSSEPDPPRRARRRAAVPPLPRCSASAARRPTTPSTTPLFRASRARRRLARSARGRRLMAHEPDPSRELEELLDRPPQPTRRPTVPSLGGRACSAWCRCSTTASCAWSTTWATTPRSCRPRASPTARAPERLRRPRADPLPDAPPPHDAVRDVRDQAPREAADLRRAAVDPAPHRQRERVQRALLDPRPRVLPAGARSSSPPSRPATARAAARC
jgi:hypothetical protein